MQARLAARDIACRRGDRLLFRRVSFAVEAGQALQVTGPNGVGKSSLLRILAGLLRPMTGEVERQGAVGFIDERTALAESRSVAGALAFWARLDGRPAGPRQDHLERLGLAPLADVPMRYLSTGQRKRAALCRLLGQDALIWLLDEPLNGLDAGGAAGVAALLEEHLARGGACVMASHQELGPAIAARCDLTRFAG